MSKHSLWRRVIRIASAFVLIANMFTSAVAAGPLGGANATTLAREPQLTPAEIGDGSIDGLQ